MEGLGVCALLAACAQGTKLLIRENFVCKVVYHDGAVEVCDRGICTVLLAYESFPTLGVHGVSFGSGVPEIDSAGCVPFLREDIDLTDKTRYALIFRCCA